MLIGFDSYAFPGKKFSAASGKEKGRKIARLRVGFREALRIELYK